MDAMHASDVSVLLVEDDDDTRALVEGWLVELGYRVRSESAGQAGLEAAQAEDGPKVALIDIGLPDLDGLQVARTLRDKLGQRIYLVAITGFTAPADCARALESGYNAYLAKPASREALRRVLAHAQDSAAFRP